MSCLSLYAMVYLLFSQSINATIGALCFAYLLISGHRLSRLSARSPYVDAWCRVLTLQNSALPPHMHAIRIFSPHPVWSRPVLWWPRLNIAYFCGYILHLRRFTILQPLLSVRYRVANISWQSCFRWYPRRSDCLELDAVDGGPLLPVRAQRKWTIGQWLKSKPEYGHTLRNLHFDQEITCSCSRSAHIFWRFARQ
jgi:hypothetical protein